MVQTTTTAASDLVSFTCSALVSANASDAQFKGGWAYLNASTGANLATQRKVASSAGYDPDAGSVTVARGYSTIVTSGIGFEISTKLPAITDDMGIRGVREIINDTLLTIPPIDLLPVSGVTSQSAYDIPALYPWLTEKASILGIYFQDTNDEYPMPTGIMWDWLYDANAPKLLLPSEPFTTGQTFHIKARRPALTWVNQLGASWTADTDGLQYDTDEALPLRQVVRAHALSTCYRQLGAMDGPSEYRQYYRERESHWTARAYALRWWSDQKGDEDREPRFRMISFGKTYGHRGTYRSTTPG